MIRPTNVFLCGCPLDTGMTIILIFHFLFNLGYLGMTINNLIRFQGPGFITDWTEEVQFSMIALELVGLPIILGTYFIGVLRRVDVAVQTYLGYLFINFVVDTCFLAYFFVLDDAQCKVADPTRAARVVGAAFMCGFVRIMSYFFVAVCITIQVYVLYVVWSFVDDVHVGSAGPPLSSMLSHSRSVFQKERKEISGGNTGKRNGPYGHLVGTTYWGDNPGAYPSPYGYADTSVGATLGAAWLVGDEGGEEHH